jgi:hypothetical protein
MSYNLQEKPKPAITKKNCFMGQVRPSVGYIGDCGPSVSLEDGPGVSVILGQQ